jgi:glucokinase
MILAGDVGGTKTVLALYESGVNTLDKVREQTYASASFPSLDAICLDFLGRSAEVGVRTACFGVPGAVVDGFCKTTNLPWLISEAELAHTLRIPRVKLLNDLQAAGYGMLHLDDSELAVINPGRGLASRGGARRGNYAVIAAGTGLGQGFLAWTGERHLPIASEGGHSTFAPRNDLEYELRRFLARRIGTEESHVSWERILSGPGLGNVYDFLKHKGVHEESPQVAAKIKAGADKGSVVGMEAINGSDKLCAAACDLFASLYGAEAGNLALKLLATGGVFVGGGIAPKLLPILQRGAFLKSFVDKGRFEELLRGIPVLVALNDKAPLLGAARFAADSI